MKNLSTKIILLFCLCIFSSLTYAQQSKLSYGWTKDITTIRHFRGGNSREFISTQRFITYEHMFSIKKRINLCLGLGYSQFDSDHPYMFDDFYIRGLDPNSPRNDIALPRSEHYRKHQLLLPISLRFEPQPKKFASLYADLTALSTIAFHKKIDAIGNDIREGERSMYVLDNIEVNPGLGLRIWRFDIRCSYRLFNLNHTDKLFDYNTNGILENLSWDNPRKFWWTVGLRF
jgi:hypothetical protein